MSAAAPAARRAAGAAPALDRPALVSALSRPAVPWWLEIGFWLAAIAIFFVIPDRALLLTDIAILGLFALSLDLILGYAGIVSLGHAAFFGTGAYVAGILAVNGFGWAIPGLLLGGVVAAAIGFVSSFLILRGSDLTRLMITLGVALILLELANRFSDWTGGADGLYGVTMQPVLGLFEFDLYGHTAYFYALAVLFLCLMLARLIVASPFGHALRAIKGNRMRAAHLGIGTSRHLVGIYTLAAFIAGIAGALNAQTTQFVSLEVLDFARSADILLILVLGGTGYLYGGLIGAVIFKVLQEILSDLTPEYWQFWIGLLLVVIVLAGRERMGERLRGLFVREREEDGEALS
ncbi:branched-chain amino acid ABC transporter permease [Aurantimonas sp. VKM B-3413]|uniref:branched-chain amino acid ABC transporter permease n=1 Tax=Aurantimonas sp. VKM B-3413 TaxID=2779401 RepID=UPI001E4FF77A|nr:branched-chain amino acid ABC transporter permease [Aurantimonas sp. VKM B-3413]MCB8839001.1 branched-chain amino acid ABC transporter permease [Aurantimonas sp. VKM B-3413]